MEPRHGGQARAEREALREIAATARHGLSANTSTTLPWGIYDAGVVTSRAPVGSTQSARCSTLPSWLERRRSLPAPAYYFATCARSLLRLPHSMCRATLPHSGGHATLYDAQHQGCQTPPMFQICNPFRLLVTVRTVNHRGRHQAQGSDIPTGNCSQDWGCPEPYPAKNGHEDLTSVEQRLSRSAKEKRAIPFKQARRFINNAQRAGGVGPTRPSFPAGRPGEKTDIRVDIEVWKGLAFV